jgi:hypothetical protein
MKWRQRAKEKWLQLGDRNTKYFHSCATQRNQRAQIMKIKDKDGRWCYSQEDIEAAFVGYFTELFTAGKEMDMEINQTLLAEFTVEEISSAIH